MHSYAREEIAAHVHKKLLIKTNQGFKERVFRLLCLKKMKCPRGEIGRHKGLKFNLSALSESLKVELVKFGEGFTANTEPRQHVLQGVETRQQAPVKWRRYSPDHKDESRNESYGGMKILPLLGVPVRVWPRAPQKHRDKLMVYYTI